MNQPNISPKLDKYQRFFSKYSYEDFKNVLIYLAEMERVVKQNQELFQWGVDENDQRLLNFSFDELGTDSDEHPLDQYNKLKNAVDKNTDNTKKYELFSPVEKYTIIFEYLENIIGAIFANCEHLLKESAVQDPEHQHRLDMIRKQMYDHQYKYGYFPLDQLIPLKKLFNDIYVVYNQNLYSFMQTTKSTAGEGSQSYIDTVKNLHYRDFGPLSDLLKPKPKPERNPEHIAVIKRIIEGECNEEKAMEIERKIKLGVLSQEDLENIKQFNEKTIKKLMSILEYGEMKKEMLEQLIEAIEDVVEQLKNTDFWVSGDSTKIVAFKRRIKLEQLYEALKTKE